MRVAVLTVKVPFVRGGAEILAENLCQQLERTGHEVEIIAIPFKWYPAERVLDHMLACRLLDLSESCGTRIDKVIGLKFPAYLAPHPAKSLWLVHQHRPAYELWQAANGCMHRQPLGSVVRDAVQNADSSLIPDAQSIFTISQTVTHRLKSFNGIRSTPLYHPPKNEELHYWAEPEDYFFFPSRINPIKRQELVLQALELCRHPVRVRFAGPAGGLCEMSLSR